MLPIISSFFIDTTTGKGKIITAFLIVITIVLIGIQVYLSTESEANLVAEKEKAMKVESWKSGIIAKLSGLLSSDRDSARAEKYKIGNFVNFGWTSHHPLFMEALMADQERTQLMEVVPPPNNMVTIENLPNSIDKMIVSWSLEELGYMVHSEQTQDFLSELDPSSEDEEEAEDEIGGDEDEDEDEDDSKEKAKKSTSNKELEVANTMYYGHKVRNNDIKLIVYTMIRAGVELKMLRPMKERKAETARSIRFEWSKNYSKRETLSVSKIKKAKRFKR